MKLFKRLLVLIFILLIVSVFARNMLVKFAAQHIVKKSTGLPLHIKGLKIGLKEPIIDIDDMVLNNPANFRDKVMAEVPDIYIDYDKAELIKGNLHFNHVRFHLSEFVVIKSGEGEINIDALKVMRRQPSEPPVPEDAPKPQRSVQMDKLELKIDRLVYKDYSSGIDPKIQSFNLNIHETFTDVADLESLVQIILVRSLSKAGISRLVGVNLSQIREGVQGIISTSTTVATETIKEAVGIVDDTTDAFMDKARKMKDLFKD